MFETMPVPVSSWNKLRLWMYPPAGADHCNALLSTGNTLVPQLEHITVVERDVMHRAAQNKDFVGGAAVYDHKFSVALDDFGVIVGNAVVANHDICKASTRFRCRTTILALWGSSGLPHDVRQALSDSIIQNLHQRMDYISAKQESDMEFQNIVPAEDYKRVVLLDIGSGNSKGSYADVRDDGTRLISFSIPLARRRLPRKLTPNAMTEPFWSPPSPCAKK